MFHHVELDARSGLHRLAIINQQADYLGLICWDGATYVYSPHLESECPAAMMVRARETLPERDREVLSQPRPVPQELSRWSTLRHDDRWTSVVAVLESSEDAYGDFVSAWRALAHPAVIEMALEALCRDAWRQGFIHLEGPRAHWFEADPRWRMLAEKLTKAVEVPLALAAVAHELAHRDALLTRAEEHLRVPEGVARYARITAKSTHAESVASVRAWKQALGDPNAAPVALERLEETKLQTLEPRPRVLCEDIITALGAHRHEPAIPLLTTLWERGQRELRIRAGHALLAFDTAPTYDVLVAKLPHVEPPYLRTAIIAELQRDPRHAFDRLSAHVEAGGEDFFLAVVEVLHRDDVDVRRGRKSARAWFGADPRWRERLEPLARASSRTHETPSQAIAALAYELLRS